MKDKDKIAKELQNKVSKEFGLFKEMDKNWKEFDKFLNSLAKKNGITKL